MQDFVGLIIGVGYLYSYAAGIASFTTYDSPMYNGFMLKRVDFLFRALSSVMTGHTASNYLWYLAHVQSEVMSCVIKTPSEDHDPCV